MGRPKLFTIEFKCNICNFILKLEGTENDITKTCNFLIKSHKDYRPKCKAAEKKDFSITSDNPGDIEDHNIIEARMLVERGYKTTKEILEKNLKFDDIIGNEDIKDIIKTRLISYTEHKEKLIKLKMYPSSGIILAGIQGTGKSDIVVASVNDIIVSNDRYKDRYNILILKSHNFMASSVGDSGKKIEAILGVIREFNKENKKDTILIIDEIDILIPNRETHSVLTQERTSSLLSEFGGLHDDHTIFIMGTTNKPDKIDSEGLVSRRFGNPVIVNIPTEKERFEMFKKFTTNLNLEDELRTEKFTTTSFNNFSGRDIHDFVTDLQTLYFEKERRGEHNSEPVITYDEVMNLLETQKYRATPERNKERLNILNNYYHKYNEDVRGSESFTNKSDVVKKYIEERLDIAPGYSILTEDVFTDYMGYPGYVEIDKKLFSRYILDDERISIHRPLGPDGKQRKAYLNVKFKDKNKMEVKT